MYELIQTIQASGTPYEMDILMDLWLKKNIK